MGVRHCLAGFLAVACATGCAIQRAEKAQTAKAAMIGMSKEDVLACMGPPTQTASVGGTEVWSYPSGNGATATFSTASVSGQSNTFLAPHYASTNGSAFGFGSSVSARRFCTVSIVMRGGAVSAVNYNGPTGGFVTQGEQCAYAVENCLH